MFFRRSKERELKMIWEVVKDGNISLLIGTAHFFPHSFQRSLTNCIESSRVVIFEGPLDVDNMNRVVNSGIDCQDTYHIFDDLDQRTVDRITHKVAPQCRDKDKFMIFNLRNFSIENPVYEMVRGMKPWLAFFTIWSNYLHKIGWKYSVDLEGHTIARRLSKKIVYLESIEEQIRVLENLSRDRIIGFLKQVDRWPELAQDYADCYLAADLEKLKSRGLRFPSRHHSVIDHRDRIFFERMLEHVTHGDAAVFVGAPHVRGISKFLLQDGFRITGPGY
jgi:hypothetical protein